MTSLPCYATAGRRWVVDVDLAQFFDRVNHDLLMGRLAKRIADARLLTLIRRYLEAAVELSGGMEGLLPTRRHARSLRGRG
jgi:retron-type reverse transcriptase